MNWCSVYLTPQGLPKYIYLSPPLIFPTTYNGIRTKKRPVSQWIPPGAAPIRWMGPIRNPRWEQKRTEGYVIISSVMCTLWSDNTCVFTRFHSVKNANTKLIWSSARYIKPLSPGVLFRSIQKHYTNMGPSWWLMPVQCMLVNDFFMPAAFLLVPFN